MYPVHPVHPAHPLRTEQNLSYGIFDSDHRDEVRELAQRLRAREHRVAIHEGDAFEPPKLPARGLNLEQGLISGMTVMGVLGISGLAIATFSPFAHLFGELSSAHLLGLFALTLGIGAVAGIMRGLTTAAPELRAVEDRLDSPERFALTVGSPLDARERLEIQLLRAGALSVGSL